MLINMCRICGKSNICERSLKLFESSNRKLVRHINMLTGLRLKEIQDAPVFICVCCQSDLRIAMTFRKLCIKTQKKWQTRARVTDDSSVSEADSPVESPHCRPKRHIKEEEEPAPAPHQTLQVMLKEEPGLNDLNEEEHDHLDLNYDVKPAIDSDDSVNTFISKSDKDEDYVPPVRPVPDTSKRRKSGEKVKAKAQDYICELCGTHVNSKVSFDRHIRKHTGERPHGCELCSARFLSAAELRSHGFSHTGERPFPCRYCDRRYVSYMGRLKHERTHTNERPFVCAQCGKAFTNGYVLKNHMLVHTGEREFKCDLCQRAFQRKTHLRTHYRSNTHKQNVEKHQSAEAAESALPTA